MEKSSDRVVRALDDECLRQQYYKAESFVEIAWRNYLMAYQAAVYSNYSEIRSADLRVARGNYIIALMHYLELATMWGAHLYQVPDA